MDIFSEPKKSKEDPLPLSPSSVPAVPRNRQTSIWGQHPVQHQRTFFGLEGKIFITQVQRRQPQEIQMSTLNQNGQANITT